MNKAILIGNLSKDPELRTTQSGKSVCSFNICVNRSHTDGHDFFNVIAWGALGENCSKYLKKGNKCSVVGEIQNREYEKDGQKRHITEIIASEVEFLTPKEKIEKTDEEVPF